MGETYTRQVAESCHDEQCCNKITSLAVTESGFSEPQICLRSYIVSIFLNNSSFSFSHQRSTQSISMWSYLLYSPLSLQPLPCPLTAYTHLLLGYSSTHLLLKCMRTFDEGYIQLLHFIVLDTYIPHGFFVTRDILFFDYDI